jgi:N-acetylated-alpha-linked acidic dipeptidase
VDNKVTPIWNTVAVIPGHITDEVVAIGNHRDGMPGSSNHRDIGHLLRLLIAWVLGATDPTSGTVSLHELVRGLGALLKKGWKPLRTILIATWDAEEVRNFHVVYLDSLDLIGTNCSTVSLEAPNGAKTLPNGSTSM